MITTSHGPLGALLALANVKTSLHGVSVRRVGSGRESSNDMGHGETSLTICYLDGKRSTRQAALARLREHISEGERVQIEGPGIFS